MPGIMDFQLQQMEIEEPLWAARWTEAKHSLVKDFKAVENVLATSEAEKKLPPSEPDLSSALLNSEYSPYGCDETVTTLGIRHWGYQPGSTPSLEEMVVQYLPLPLKARFRRLLPWDKPQAVLEKLAELGRQFHCYMVVARLFIITVTSTRTAQERYSSCVPRSRS